MRIALAVAAALLLQAAQSAAPPDTEIYLCELTRAGGGLTVGPPLNISNSPGYDNQPTFTPDGAAILFTSVRGHQAQSPANGAASGSDIYRYDIGPKSLRQLTSTPESEYSPTVTPDGAHFSTVRVEADGTQRLWRFTMAGQDASLVLADVKPVGYHAWVDASTVALFILGQPQGQANAQPATLQLADITTGKARVVASNIARSVLRMPDGRISFVLRDLAAGGPPVLSIHALDPKTGGHVRLVEAPAGANEVDAAWTPDGMLLVSQPRALLGWRAGDPALAPVANLAPLGLRGVTRLAVSPRGDRIAIVAQPE
jgi:hypothetical protein